ncbi:histidine phosphatase family protein [Streptomyces sp. NPDC029003]|uniref:histidine phosphatase family protein n=1 Tax=Streptomyces sp. NPDC029003 TaxID=3155125 RepID=UPI0033ECF385
MVLLRHGETDRNAADRFQAQADVPLNDTGVRQAQDTARALRPGKWAAVYSSPLARAAQTAAYAAGRLDVPHLRVDGLRERDLGALDGQDRAAFARRHPHTMRRLLTDPDYAPPGGESGRAARSRFAAALAGIAGTGPDPAARPVLVVTHGGVLNLLTRALTGAAAGAAPDILIGTCAAARVDTAWTPGGRPRFALRQWNVAPHACEDPPPPPHPLPFVDLDDLTAEESDSKEVTRT